MKRWILALVAAASFPAEATTEMDYRLQPRAVSQDVYVFVGKTEDFSTANGGNVVNTGFIVAPEGVIVLDTGPSLRYGRQMREAIARVTDKPVVMALNTHHHPDHFLGNQAFSDVQIATLADIQRSIRAEGNAFAENLYRMSGDWMSGTEVVVPEKVVEGGAIKVAGRSLRILALDGHTGADLALYDEKSGVLFAGDLVFNNRAPTTPHANVEHWLRSLATLEEFMAKNGVKLLVPGHGEVVDNAAPIGWTRGWLVWLTDTLRQSAEQGLDMNETIARPLPEPYRNMPLGRIEFRRSVETLFRQAEMEALEKVEAN